MPDPIRPSEASLVPFARQQLVTSAVQAMPPPGRVVNVPPPPIAARSLLSASAPARLFNPATIPAPVLSTPMRPASASNLIQPIHRGAMLPSRPPLSLAEVGMKPGTPAQMTALRSQPEICDISSLRYTQNLLSQRPHLAELIFHEAIQLHKKTLQDFIGKSEYGDSDRYSIQQAVEHLLVKENPARLKAIEKRVKANEKLSEADKTHLLIKIERQAQWSLAAHEERPSPPIDYAALAPALNKDLISMLIKSGVTKEQLQNYVEQRTAADNIIKLDLMLVNDHALADKLQSSAEHQALPEELKFAAEHLIDAFESEMYTITDHLDRRIGIRIDHESDVFRHTLQDNYPAENFDSQAPLSAFVNHPLAGINEHEVYKNRTIRLLESNFLRSYPLVQLFKQISNHSPVRMVRSVLNQEQLAFINNLNDATKLDKMLEPQYGKRARRLLSTMQIAPFVFGDSAQPPAMNIEGLHYGYRGLPFTTIDGWLRDPTISEQRLEDYGHYCNVRFKEISLTGKLDSAGWMVPLSDETLALFFAKRFDLVTPSFSHHHHVIGNVLKHIGQAVIREDYDYQHLPELLAWVRNEISTSASDNELVYLLINNFPSGSDIVQARYNLLGPVKLSLPTIAAQIRRARNPDTDFTYPPEKIAEDLRQVIRNTITPKALNQLRAPEELGQQINNALSQERILAFAAQRFGIRIIQEDGMDEFRRYYHPSGTIYTTPPAEQGAALILRPGSLTPVNADGRLRQTIELEQGDNHSLLRELMMYYWDRPAPGGEEFNEALLVLEQEIIDSQHSPLKRDVNG